MQLFDLSFLLVCWQILVVLVFWNVTKCN